MPAIETAKTTAAPIADRFQPRSRVPCVVASENSSSGPAPAAGLRSTVVASGSTRRRSVVSSGSARRRSIVSSGRGSARRSTVVASSTAPSRTVSCGEGSGRRAPVSRV